MSVNTSKEPITLPAAAEVLPANSPAPPTAEVLEVGALTNGSSVGEHADSNSTADGMSGGEAHEEGEEEEEELASDNATTVDDIDDNSSGVPEPSPAVSVGSDVVDGDTELEEIARYLDASRETLQSIMGGSSTSMASTGTGDDVLAVGSSASSVLDAEVVAEGSADLQPDFGAEVAPAADATALSTEVGSSGSPSSGSAPPPSASSSPQQQPVTVFKQLTRKLKELEIDQSVMSSYLSDLRTSYSSSIAGLQLAVDSLRATAEQGERAKDTKLDTLAHAVFEMREALALLYHRHVSLLRRMHTLEGDAELSGDGTPQADDAEEEGEVGQEDEEDEEEDVDTGPPGGTCDGDSSDDDVNNDGGFCSGLVGAIPEGERRDEALHDDQADSPATHTTPRAAAAPLTTRCGSWGSDPRRAFYASELRTIEEMREVFDDADSAGSETDGRDCTSGIESAAAPESPRSPTSRAAAPTPVATVFYPAGRTMAAFLDDTHQLLVGWVTSIAVGRGVRPAGSAALPAIPVPLPVPVPVPVAVNARSAAPGSVPVRHRRGGSGGRPAPAVDSNDEDGEGSNDGDDGAAPHALRQRLRELERRLADAAAMEERMRAAAETAERALALCGVAAVACSVLALASCCSLRQPGRRHCDRRAASGPP